MQRKGQIGRRRSRDLLGISWINAELAIYRIAAEGTSDSSDRSFPADAKEFQAGELPTLTVAGVLSAVTSFLSAGVESKSNSVA